MRYWTQAYGLFLGVVAILADQASKHLVIEKFDWAFFASKKAITPFFNIVLVQNTGISFGLFSDFPGAGVWILSGLAIVICLVLLRLMFRTEDTVSIMSFGLIIGGALGNVIDRILYGGVTDFLDFHAFNYHWPAFNLADSFIFIGVGVLLICNFQRK